MGPKPKGGLLVQPFVAVAKTGKVFNVRIQLKRLNLMVFLLIWSFGAFACTNEPIWGTDVVTKKPVEVRPAQEAKATVAVFLSSLCPCAKSHEPVLTELANKYPDYKFVGIVSGQEDPKEIAEHFVRTKLPFPVIQDSKSQLADRYGALKTPHVFIISREGKCLYNGGIDNSKEAPRATKHFLKMAFEDLSANRELRFKEARTLGCVIKR